MKQRVSKIKRVAVTSLAAVCALSSVAAISASAVTARTNTYYVYQEKSYGTLTLTQSYINASTYCELARAGKIAKTDYEYYYNGMIDYAVSQAGGNYDRNTFNDTSNSTTVSAVRGLDDVDRYIWAKSYHKVKINSYITWNSAGCVGNTNGYDIPYIILDY